MDSDAFKIFVTIAEIKSFTQAAKLLNVAQPTISTRLKRLEKQLGFSLFHRSARAAITLTAGGEEFLIAARHALEAHERAIAFGQKIAKKIKGPCHSARIALRSESPRETPCCMDFVSPTTRSI
jgi:DNA-binding transcriptional LysR family regulator